jgi:vacuolar-type H+-ATPase subunit I/STV1
MQSFTMTDTMGTLAATVLLGLFLLPPGFLLGYASNVLAFRQRSASERLLISLALSMAVVPVISVLLVRVAGMTVALALFLLAAIAACVMLARQYKAQPSGCSLPQRSTWFALAMMLAWVCLALFCLVDWDTLGRLYISYSAYDHSIRVMMVDAALRTGVPPRNPLFDLGTAPILRYYYYWYVICALPVRLGGLTPRAGLNGQASPWRLWCRCT